MEMFFGAIAFTGLIALWFAAVVVVHLVALTQAQSVYPTGTTIYDPDRAWNGWTVLSPLAGPSVPVIDMNVAATVQSTPGPVLAANRQFTNAEIIPSLGRPLSAQAANATINMLLPGDMYGDRVNQFDVRLGKTIRFGGRRASVNLDIYNLFNANPVMQENAAYAVWRTPQRIMDARLFKVSGQLDF